MRFFFKKKKKFPWWWTVKVNFKGSSMQRCQCPIYNGTLKSFVKYELSMQQRHAHFLLIMNNIEDHRNIHFSLKWRLQSSVTVTLIEKCFPFICVLWKFNTEQEIKLPKWNSKISHLVFYLKTLRLRTEIRTKLNIV